jgi:Fe-S cluster assembly protein SufD
MGEAARREWRSRGAELMAARIPSIKDRFVALYDPTRFEDEMASVRDLRRHALERFAALGFPTSKDESWKYTDVSKVVGREYVLASAPESVPAEEALPYALDVAGTIRVVFVDGYHVPELSSSDLVSRGLTVVDLRRAVVDGAPTIDEFATLAPVESEAFVALNTSLAAGGAVVTVTEGHAVEQVVHILYLSTCRGGSVLSNPRTLVVARPGSVSRFVETFVSLGDGPGMTNAVAEFVLHDGAVVEHFRVQDESERAVHVGSTDVVVGRDASYTAVSTSYGAALARHDLRVRLAGQHARCQIDGLYIVDGAQHCDSHTVIDHSVPHCASSQLYKGVLDGKSRAVFNGKVIVRPDAQKTDARQTNRNLLLSSDARVDTKPELEIFADDVACTHGATVGALDDEERFYLASRGLDDDTARGLLTYGFAEEIVAEVTVEPLRRRLDEKILAKYHRGSKVW